MSPSTSSRVAPYARITRWRSGDFEAGITMVASYPFAAATIAMPMPVLPEVGSTMVSPGSSAPSRSAASTIARAGRSFALPPGFFDSNFAATTLPGGEATCTSGEPTVPSTLRSITRPLPPTGKGSADTGMVCRPLSVACRGRGR